MHPVFFDHDIVAVGMSIHNLEHGVGVVFVLDRCQKLLSLALDVRLLLLVLELPGVVEIGPVDVGR